MHEDSLCPGCGQPKDHAWDPRNEGEYEVHKVTCQACAVRDGDPDRKDGKTKPGEYFLVGPATPAQPPTAPAPVVPPPPTSSG